MEELKKEIRDDFKNFYYECEPYEHRELGLEAHIDFWFGKLAKQQETQKAEIISLIYSMILNKEVDDVEASKIINKIRQ